MKICNKEINKKKCEREECVNVMALNDETKVEVLGGRTYSH